MKARKKSHRSRGVNASDGLSCLDWTLVSAALNESMTWVSETSMESVLEGCQDSLRET